MAWWFVYFSAEKGALTTHHSNSSPVDRIIDYLKLRFIAEKPRPSHVFTEVAVMEAEESGEYF